jgi:hypothetical protein
MLHGGILGAFLALIHCHYSERIDLDYRQSIRNIVQFPTQSKLYMYSILGQLHQEFEQASKQLPNSKIVPRVADYLSPYAKQHQAMTNRNSPRDWQ